MNDSRLFFRVHAVQRMFERKISVKSVSQAIRTGETVEDYSSEMPEPGRLILSFQGKRPFHVVTSETPAADRITVITAYIPDASQWRKDFKRRRS